MIALYAFATATGIVLAGLGASTWGMVAGKPPSFGLLLQQGLPVPLRSAALVACGPLLVLSRGCRLVMAKPLAAIALIITGLVWSFLQGVFILTQVFGLT